MPESTLLVIFFTSFVVGLSGSLIPGPLLTIAITESSRRGFWVGPALILGHGIVELVLVLVLARGLANLLDKAFITSGIGVVGGLFLLWIAYGIIKGTLTGEISLDVTPKAGIFNPPPYLEGMLASVFNPSWLIWWATIGAAYVLWSLQEGAAGIVFFYSGHILSDLSWYTFVSFVVATGRRMITNDIFRGVLLACGLFMVVLSALFVFNGVEAWLRVG